MSGTLINIVFKCSYIISLRKVPQAQLFRAEGYLPRTAPDSSARQKNFMGPIQFLFRFYFKDSGKP